MNTPDSRLPERDGPAGEGDSYPIGFKIAVVLTALYLLYRLVQGLARLGSSIFG